MIKMIRAVHFYYRKSTHSLFLAYSIAKSLQKSGHAILSEIKQKFGLTSPLPEDFDGIPVVNNQRSWFFSYQYRRQKDDIPEVVASFSSCLGEECY